MNGMRIKNHKPQFNRNQQNSLQRPDRFTRYTPLGAIRLLPPVTSANVVAATSSATTNKVAGKKAKVAAKTAKSGPKRRAKTLK